MLTKLVVTIVRGSGIALGAGASPGANLRLSGNAALDLPAGAASVCSISCDLCTVTSYHVTWSGVARAITRDGAVHPCISNGSCAEYHGVCSPTLSEDLVDGARYAALASSVDELVALQRTHPDRVLVNAGRNAVQLADCDGHLMTNFPVTVEVIAHFLAQEE